MRRLLVVIALAACAPRVDGPVEQQRTADARDADRLAAQLAALPGVVKTEVVLRRAARDPLAVTPPSTPALSMVVIVDDRADRAELTARATALGRALAPELTPTIVVEVGVERPQLARVGPFRVEAQTRGPLRATLALALLAIAALAGWIAWQHRSAYRRGNSAQ